MKIVYAICDNYESVEFVRRFLLNKPDNFNVKVAGYDTCKFADWNLSCITSIYNKGYVTKHNENLYLYLETIKRFNPDLIISDYEPITNNIIGSTNIPIWQVSTKKLNIALNKFISHNYHSLINQEDLNVNKTKQYVISPLCDMEISPLLKDEFNYIRPYYKLGSKSEIFHYNSCAVSYKINYNIIKKLPAKSVYFCDQQGYYKDIILKNIYDDDYYLNIKNCDHIIHSVDVNYLSDAFYNNKKSTVTLDFSNTICLTNSAIYEHYGLCKTSLNSEFIEYDFKAVNNLHNEIKYIFAIK